VLAAAIDLNERKSNQCIFIDSTIIIIIQYCINGERRTINLASGRFPMNHNTVSVQSMQSTVHVTKMSVQYICVKRKTNKNFEAT
jgi:hypothetical protein